MEERVKPEKWATKEIRLDISSIIALKEPHALMQGEEACNKIGRFTMIKHSILE